MTKGKVIAEGKTKIVHESVYDGHVVIESKDDITAGDGAQKDELKGKAVAATTTTCNVFQLLNSKGIPTHYLRRDGEKKFRAKRAEMIPLELVVRRVATGSYLKRNPDAVEGEVFETPVFEIFHKDDDAHDPILVFDESGVVATRYPADQPEADREPIGTVDDNALLLGRQPDLTLEQLEEFARETFKALEEAWADQDVQLVDLKIECGWIDGPDGQELVVADVVDNDSWRIWPKGDKTEMKDKQVFRDLAGVEDPKAKAKEMGKIKENYEWVAERTERFV